MNFEKLITNLQEDEKKLESQVLPYCNPKQIANELMSKLEAVSGTIQGENWVTSSGLRGEIGSPHASYELWYIRKPDQWDKVGLSRGPLSECNGRIRLSQVVLNLVKKYINNDIIQLGVDAYDSSNSSSMSIHAIISPADIKKLK